MDSVTLMAELWFEDEPQLDLAALAAAVPGADLAGDDGPIMHPRFVHEYADGKRATISTIAAAPSGGQRNGDHVPTTAQTWDWDEAGDALARCSHSLLIAELMGLAETWLGHVDRAASRLRIPAAVKRPAVAVGVTFLVLLYPLARDPGGGITAAAAGTLGLVLLVALVLRARAAAARRASAQAGQESWSPGLAFGAGAAVAGLTWTPLPVLRNGADPRVHWAGTLALALLAIPLVLFTAWFDVPLTRALATAALVMAASLLTPVKPVDGGAIAAAGGTAAGLTGLGLAALLALGLV